MKIVFLISSMGPGGAERVAATLCNAWATRGDRVTLIATFSGGGTQPFYALSRQVEFFYLAHKVAGAKGAAGYLRRTAALRRLIAARVPDVIVSFLPNVNVTAIVSSAFLGIPRIICERSDPSSRRYSWQLAAMCRLCYRFADMLAVQTETVAGKVKRLYPGLAAVRAVPNPLSAAFPAAGRTRQDERKVLLSLGRLSPEKQTDMLVRAFGVLSPRFAGWDLHIYGDGPLREALAAQIRERGLEARVRLMGVTQEPWKVMADADAFAMTSAYEGFPNALLEAMAAGLPCVAFDCPSGPRELSSGGRHALLVPPNDEPALVAALASVMEDEDFRAAIGRGASESVQSRFSLDAILLRWDDFFHEVGAARRTA